MQGQTLETHFFTVALTISHATFARHSHKSPREARGREGVEREGEGSDERRRSAVAKEQ